MASEFTMAICLYMCQHIKSYNIILSSKIEHSKFGVLISYDFYQDFHISLGQNVKICRFCISGTYLKARFIMC